MIVSLHVATGAVAGVAAGSRGRAVILGALAHFLGDRVPHYDIGDRRFEIWSGAAALAAVAVRRGPFDPATIGAAAGSAPDLEHVVRLPRPGGRKLFPSHRIRGWHRRGGESTRDRFSRYTRVTRAPLTPPRQPSGYASRSHVSVHEPR
jgi:hypothetical protein